MSAKGYGAIWLCQCKCGTLKKTLASGLKKAKSCGCLNPKKKIDMSGQRFGNLVAIKTSGLTRQNSVKWLCKCQCGGEKIVDGSSLRQGLTKSCGCLGRTKKESPNKRHGKTKTKVYRAWAKLRSRCTNPNDARWDSYGGRELNSVKDGMCLKTFMQIWDIHQVRSTL
jgi:hypothetical protein